MLSFTFGHFLNAVNYINNNKTSVAAITDVLKHLYDLRVSLTATIFSSIGLSFVGLLSLYKETQQKNQQGFV